MHALLSLSKKIDALSEWVGRWVAWLLLFAVLISAANAVVRKAFNMSSNGFLEIQWYLFAATLIIKLAMPLVINAYVTQEVSSNAGGLIRWPVFALLPAGLLLLGIQAVSELIKRIAFLQGLIPDPTKKQGSKTPEEELAEFLLQKEVAARDAARMGARP
ncbi:MAG: sugar transporter [Betaproteobacteria bacterium]|nr:sugar transporter [Betaproteobacteria bacterium]